MNESKPELLPCTGETAYGSPWLRQLYLYFAPVRQEIVDRGISEDEVNADIDAAIKDLRSRRGTNRS